ncbi:MAG: hypothetical protein IPH36_20425 [Saprospiraceae bacterium]|nr:hypothetical protein [Saprospiraceae bacterium]
MIIHQNAPTHKMFSWVRNLVPIHVLSAFFLLFLSHLSIAQTVITYNYTGSMQTYTVPPGVYSINISASGAQGAGGAGGNGGQATGDLNVTPGQILNIFVGGQDGYNGGGSGYAAVARNGGGASDVRMTGTSLADRIIVGGGGGGGGFTDVGTCRWYRRRRNHWSQLRRWRRRCWLWWCWYPRRNQRWCRKLLLPFRWGWRRWTYKRWRRFLQHLLYRHLRTKRIIRTRR